MRGKAYEMKKSEIGRRQGFKAMAKGSKEERSKRFRNINPETTDSRADG